MTERSTSTFQSPHLKDAARKRYVAEAKNRSRRRGGNRGTGQTEGRSDVNDAYNFEQSRGGSTVVAAEEDGYETVFSNGNLLGISSGTVRDLSEIDPDDRTENLGLAVADAGELDIDETTNALLALSHMNLLRADAETRATVIDYCARTIGQLGLTITEVEKP